MKAKETVVWRGRRGRQLRAILGIGIIFGLSPMVPVTGAEPDDVSVSGFYEASFASTSFSVSESVGTAQIDIILTELVESLSVQHTGPFDVGFKTVVSAGPSPATPGSDFVEVVDVLSLSAPGGTGPVEIIDDSIEEPDETIGLELFSADSEFGADIGFPDMATLTIVDDDAPQSQPSRGGGGSDDPSRVSSASAGCSSGKHCGATVVGRNETFEIVGYPGGKARLKAKLRGGRKPSCRGGDSSSKDWVQFFFSEGGDDRAKKLTVTVRNLDDDRDSEKYLRREEICFAAPYDFEVKDRFHQTRDKDGEFLGILPDCDDLDSAFDWEDRRNVDVDSPCVADREIGRRYSEKVFEIVVLVPAHDLDPRVRRD